MASYVQSLLFQRFRCFYTYIYIHIYDLTTRRVIYEHYDVKLKTWLDELKYEESAPLVTQAFQNNMPRSAYYVLTVYKEMIRYVC